MPVNTEDGGTMTGYSNAVATIKGQISKFSGIITKGPSAKQRLVKETIYGIQAAKDMELSSITRALNESIPLSKTEDRLSRNLDDEDFTTEINNQTCRLGGAEVLEIWSSPSIRETYGRSMPQRWSISVKSTMEANMK
jgi:hypothetical protein